MIAASSAFTPRILWREIHVIPDLITWKTLHKMVWVGVGGGGWGDRMVALHGS
jgi:hypothetical protein